MDSCDIRFAGVCVLGCMGTKMGGHMELEGWGQTDPAFLVASLSPALFTCTQPPVGVGIVHLVGIM